MANAVNPAHGKRADPRYVIANGIALGAALGAALGMLFGLLLGNLVLGVGGVCRLFLDGPGDHLCSEVRSYFPRCSWARLIGQAVEPITKMIDDILRYLWRSGLVRQSVERLLTDLPALGAVSTQPGHSCSLGHQEAGQE